MHITQGATMQPPLIMILCDSINNSVFESQVLQPLLAHEAPRRQVIIASYETTTPDEHTLLKIKVAHPHLSCHILKRRPWLDLIFPYFARKQLNGIIRRHTPYELKARGPLAGRLALGKATGLCMGVTIQARGLMAQEFMFNPWQRYRWLQKLIYRWLNRLEKKIYRQAVERGTIEAVSQALKEYICHTYGIASEHITIAAHDLPEPIPLKTRALWKAAVRTELNIDREATVYCYNGSLKPWQQPEAIIDFFKRELQTDPQSFLLVLTPDSARFRDFIAHAGLPTERYVVRTVPHDSMYRYLAAGDKGIIFREPHIVNWVSRPTKALEYQAVGLEIIHNNTIDYLQRPRSW